MEARLGTIRGLLTVFKCRRLPSSMTDLQRILLVQNPWNGPILQPDAGSLRRSRNSLHFAPGPLPKPGNMVGLETKQTMELLAQWI